MITYKKLKIYQKREGDGDRWRVGSWWWQKNNREPEDWSFIGQAISDLKMIKNGLAAPSYI